MGVELELKLCLKGSAAEALFASPLLATKPDLVVQHSTYFDTPELALWDAGLSLRIRSVNGERIQTVKSDNYRGAGLFSRLERERPIDDVPSLDEGSTEAALVGGAELVPVFEVRNERRRWQLDVDGSQIEAALDQGIVLVGDRSSPVLEIELELKAGDPATLFAVGREVDAVATTRLSAISKAERGYRLLDSLPARYKAEPIVLAAGITIGEAFPAIVGSCLRQYLLNADLLSTSLMLPGKDGAEALHQARVSLRRLRAAFKIFKPMLWGDDQWDRLDGELRALAQVLGEARDLDVMLERTEPGALRRRLRLARTAAYGRVCERLDSSRTRALLLDLTEWNTCGPWSQAPELSALRETPCEALASDALKHFRRKVRKAGRALRTIDDEKRHALRKNAKKLRYAAEFFSSLSADTKRARRVDPFLAALETVQDRLGAVNDHATRPRILETLGLAEDPQAHALVGYTDKDGLLDGAARAMRRFSQARRFWVA